MTDHEKKGEGPARAYQNNGYWGVTVGGHSIIHFGPCGEEEERAEKEAMKINRALAPLTKKAEMCGKMDEALRRLFPFAKDCKSLACQGAISLAEDALKEYDRLK